MEIKLGEEKVEIWRLHINCSLVVRLPGILNDATVWVFKLLTFRSKVQRPNNYTPMCDMVTLSWPQAYVVNDRLIYASSIHILMYFLCSYLFSFFGSWV